jgi:hypothetical protein
LIFGTIFAGFTVVWILTVSDTIDDNQAWLGGPIILIVAGAVGLAAALRPRPPADPAATYPDPNSGE